MRTIYIECNMGAAGDMLTAALLELLPDPEGFLRTMNEAGIPGMRMTRSEKQSCGVRGTHIAVQINGEEEISDDVPEHEHHEHSHEHEEHHEHHEHEHGHHLEHHHAGMKQIKEIVSKLKLPERVKENALGVYQLVAQAEAHAHGSTVEHIHFHELGMMDAITDICAVCLLMEQLAADKLVVSPICTGFGEVRCMHGIVPVPAPATAYLLCGMPAYAGSIRGEMLTPTGAALLKYFATEFGRMPLMRVIKTGYGMGSKSFERANCVRAFLGETEYECAGSCLSDTVTELSCNLDDMSGEAIAFAAEQMMNAGALDVYLTAIQMKKGRPGTKLSCICADADASRIAELMLTHTSTLGVRAMSMKRNILQRSTKRIETPYGELHIKCALAPMGEKHKLEYEDAARAAREHGVPLSNIVRAAEDAMRK